MKSRDFKGEIAQMSAEQLKVKALSLAEELMKLGFRKTSGQLQQTSRIKETRRNLARVQTALSKLALSNSAKDA